MMSNQEYQRFLEDNLDRYEGYRIFFPRPNPSFGNPDFETADLRVLIVRLSPLENIKESISHHFLFQEVRRALPRAYIDYAFFPAIGNIDLLSKNEMAFYVGIQSLCTISDFDVVLISNSFILELLNLPYLFENTPIPALKSERKGIKPLIIMGGSNSLMAQCAISSAGDSCVDALFFGEGEDAVGRIITVINENKSLEKRKLLTLLERHIPGFFDIRMPVPGITVSSIKILRASHIITQYPVLNTDVENITKIEISKGCPCLCSFCFEGFTKKPFREFELKDIINKALETKTGHASAGFDLLSFNFNMHSGISEILANLNEMVKFVNFKSQRADIINLSKYMLEIEVLSGKRSFTIGVEGISERMRGYMHKSLKEGEILAALAGIYTKKPRQVKLFFIITGLEEATDIREFKELIVKLKQLRKKLSPKTRTIMSFGLLANLPFTPMQFKPLIKDPARLKIIKGELKRDCVTNGFEFRMAQDSEEFLISQHLVIAGHECFKFIFESARNGLYFDGEHISGTINKTELLQQLRAASGESLYMEKNEDYLFPFNSLKGTLPKMFLYRMYEEATQFLDRGYCLEGKGLCLGCGGCENKKPSKIPEISPGDVERLRKAMELKKRSQTIRIVVTLKEAARFLTPEAKCAFIGRAIIHEMPELVRSYLSCRQVYNMEPSKGYGALFGRFLFDLEFIGNARAFSEYITKKPIETPLLSISPHEKVLDEDHFQFCVTSSWNDPEMYSFQNKFQDYILQNNLGFEIRKSGGAISFEIAEKDKKKKKIYSARLMENNDHITLELETGPKFIIAALVKHLFGKEWTKTKVESF